MADTKRDVELNLTATATGGEQVRKLEAEIQQLANTGADAEKAFGPLIEELQQLGAQSNAVEAFAKIQAALDATKAELDQAAAKFKTLKETLDTQRAAVDGFVEKQKEASASLRTTADQLRKLEGELRIYKAAASDTTKSTQAYKDRVRDLGEQIAKLKTTQADQEQALRDVNVELRAANKEARQTESAYRKAANGVEQLNIRLRDQSTQAGLALGAVKALGVETETLADAQIQVQAAFERTVAAINETNAALERERSFIRSISDSNTQAAQQAKQAAADRSAAAKKAADDQRAAAEETNAALLREKLLRESIEAAVRQSNDRAVAQARQAAAEREASAKRAAAAEVAAARAAEAALLRVSLAEQEIAEKAAVAAKAIDDAFKTTGVRSINAIEKEIRDIGASLVQLSGNARISGEDFDRAFASGQARIAALTRELEGADPAFRRVASGAVESSRSVDFLRRTFLEFTAAYGAFEATTAFIQTANQAETLRRSLTFLTGSAEGAQAKIQQLTEVANRAGLSVGSIADDFIRFNAAMIRSGQSAETLNDIFTGVANAAGTLGLSSEKTGLILNALSQIANKGKVSLEELQGQLGESLPGALKIAADSLGLTTSQLTKLIESGGLLAEEFLPAFGRALNDTFDQGDKRVVSFAAAWNRLKNSITVVVQEVSDTSAWRGLATAIDAVASNMNTLVAATGSLIKAFVAFKAISIVREFLGFGTAAADAAVKQGALTVATEKQTAATAAETAAIRANTTAVAQNATAKGAAAASATGFAAAMEKISGGIGAATSRVGSFVGALGGPWGLALTTAIAFSDQLGNALASLAAKVTGVSDRLREAEDALKKEAEAQRIAAEDAKRSAAIRAESSAKIKVIYEQEIDAAEKSAQAFAKSAEAKRIEGDANIALTKLSGDLVSIMQAEATAAEGNVAARQNLAKAVDAIAASMEREREALIGAAGGLSNLSAAQRDYITALDQRIEKAKAESDLARQRLEEAKNEETQAKINAQVTRDNSARVDELRKAYVAASEVFARYSDLEAKGLVVGTDLVKLRRDMTLAEQLYKDALADTNRQLEQRIRTVQVEGQTARAAITVKMEEAKAAERIAVAMGDERAATEAKVRQKTIEIEQIKQAKAEKVAEAEATIRSLEAQREEIKGTDDLSAAKRAEIDLRIQSEKAKITEAGASDSVVKGIEAEIGAIRRKTQELITQQRVTGGMSGIGPSNDLGIDENGRTQYQRDLMSKQGGPVDNSFIFQLRDRLQRGEQFMASELPAIENALRVAQENLLAINNSRVPSLTGRNDAEMWVRTLTSIADRARAGTGAGRGSGFNVPQQAGNQPAGSLYTVNVNLNGRTLPVNTASQSDAQNLVTLLTQIGDAANRS